MQHYSDMELPGEQTVTVDNWKIWCKQVSDYDTYATCS